MLSNYHVEKAGTDHRRSRDLDANVQAMRREEEDSLDRQQHRQERAERWKMEKERWKLEQKERESWLTRSSRREGVLLGVTVLFAICAPALFFIAVDKGEVYAVGGSGLTGSASVWGMIKLMLQQSASPAVANSPSG